LRILTKESTDPALWEVSSVIDNIGPVTTSVTKLQDRSARYDKTKSLAATGKLWLYFGSGRFFYKGDAPDNSFRLYGIEEPCYSVNSGSPNFTPAGPVNDFGTASCTSTVSESDLQDQTGTATTGPLPVLPVDKRGWYVNLAATASGLQAERTITNPVASPAGAVFFTTFRPSTDICSFLGNSYIWALGFNSGAAPPAASMKGRALLQVSTGEIKEIALADSFANATDQRFDKRRTTDPITGMPPTAQGLALMANPKPTKKILHIQEK
jgi:type IV pilus assembly protein PilY1